MLAAALVACFAAPGLAMDAKPAMSAFLESEVLPWTGSEVLIAAIEAHNAETAQLTGSEIAALDAAWQSELGAAERPTIAPVIDNAAATFLRERVSAAGGAITEIFVMDARGLNVAASALTSDYWQGDEAKFTETFGKGPEAVHFGEVEFDESSQTYQGQISVTLVDPESGEAIGAMTVGVNAEYLM
ncbi:hypothetical protein Salmuc_03093 [Salipiger mucosus DSM 16094]|uniref:Uncharacterized protein n=1 Tax=Salipiger mucosus DSM 16094 TaxID=1123237 RepID=S9S6M0_9RHOB|nr:hypothetical protein Salmuc_03093 [Salipiger mucosus DSM 16094]